MPQKYEEAKRIFFENLGIPEEYFRKTVLPCIELRHKRLILDLSTSVCMTHFAGALQAALKSCRDGLQNAKASENEASVEFFSLWESSIRVLLADVRGTLKAKSCFDKVHSGGERKQQHFTKKLKEDLAIVEIEQILNLLQKKQRLYFGAGLLYYLGFGFEMFYLSQGQPFPDQRSCALSTDPKGEYGMMQRYRTRRREAQKYCSIGALELQRGQFDGGFLESITAKAKAEARSALSM